MLGFTRTLGQSGVATFNLSDFKLEDQVSLTLEETSKGLCLKDDVAFALLIVVFFHTVVMFNELDNLLGLGQSTLWGKVQMQ
jgi:hypothetical protein